MSSARTVVLSRRAVKQLEKLPEPIVLKFYGWMSAVSRLGIREVRRASGYHDEPLQGRRFGQRSIRLNRAYRAIYVEHTTGEIELIEVLEVNKHEY